jgi:hypothetical protein
MAFLHFFRRSSPQREQGATPRRDPDLRFAAKGYVQIAITRRHASHIDLHKLERGYAAELLSEGCTLEQALSARWGGAYAIVDTLEDYDRAIAAYKETMAERGLPYARTKKDAARMYEIAATLVIASAHEADPEEYGRFLRHINAG